MASLGPDRTARRYLDLLKSALVGALHLDHELRIDHLLDCLRRGVEPDPAIMRDPQRALPDEARRLREARRVGQLRDDTPPARHRYAATSMGRLRLDHLERCLASLGADAVPGDVLEIGTGGGGGGVFLRGYLAAVHDDARTVWVADTFAPGAHGADRPADDGGATAEHTDLDVVRDAYERFGLLDDRVRFLVGDPVATLPTAPIERLALVRVGPGLGPAGAAALDAVHDHLEPGAVVVVDDLSSASVGPAIDELRGRRGGGGPIERIDARGGWWRVGGDRPGTDPAREQRAGSAPSAATRGGDLDLSVVVVFHDMRREAERTLHSLSRAYQQGIDDLAYEVIAVDNGSAPGAGLDPELVAGFGPEFRLLRLSGADASPSPAPASNRGIAEARGRALALMVDGAHVLSPGVLRFGTVGLRTYEPAVVATQQWYVGPGQQHAAIAEGYDRDHEDDLFERIRWPDDGYQLFSISHFIGDRDWFDGIWESNCLFVPRGLLDRFGAYDERFSEPGGGYCNLELFERLASSPDVTVATIIGEGSFHQVHGGTTTNLSSPADRRERLEGYARRYTEVRGRPFVGPTKPLHFVGGMRPGALRTKGRRREAGHFFRRGARAGPGGVPARPEPIPAEVGEAYVEAYWRSLQWRETTWLGRSVARPPADLLAYQALLAEVRPDWVVVVDAGPAGAEPFLASVLDLLGAGRILSVGASPPAASAHERIEHVAGSPLDDRVVAAVHERVGPAPRAVLLLAGPRPRGRTVRAFDRYADLVPVGSYVVVEDTVVGGHPVWPDFGLGPAEAVAAITAARTDFAVDPRFERYGPSFSPGGFLRRHSSQTQG